MQYKPGAWLYRRTRLLNVFHALRLSSPHTQMVNEEMDCLYQYAKGRHRALEVGTYMGVSASIIASAMDGNGTLYCVDPFDSREGKTNPAYIITVRHLKRANVFEKVTFLKGFSTEQKIKEQIPQDLDFILLDGDHSYEGLKNDWEIVLNRLKPGGVLCLHDTTIPVLEPYRNFGSVEFFNKIILKDTRFKLIDTAYSMNVLVRL